jgi:hypothetical protein
MCRALVRSGTVAGHAANALTAGAHNHLHAQELKGRGWTQALWSRCQQKRMAWISIKHNDSAMHETSARAVAALRACIIHCTLLHRATAPAANRFTAILEEDSELFLLRRWPAATPESQLTDLVSQRARPERGLIFNCPSISMNDAWTRCLCMDIHDAPCYLSVQ